MKQGIKHVRLDPELQEYKERIGQKAFSKLYRHYYGQARCNLSSNSGRTEPLPGSKIDELKQKYRNGVPAGELESWLANNC